MHLLYAAERPSSHWFLGMYIHIYIHVYIYNMYIHIYIHVYIYNMYAYYICICICICTYTYTYMCVYIYPHTCVYIYPHTCGPCVTEIANAKTRDSGFTINSRASGMSASASRHRTICTKFTTAQYLIYYARTRL